MVVEKNVRITDRFLATAINRSIKTVNMMSPFNVKSNVNYFVSHT